MSVDDENDERNLSDIIDEIGFGLWHFRTIGIFSFLAMTDAMELILIAIIGPVLQCKWSLTAEHVAYISLCVVLGMLVGAIVFGYLSDRFGRRPVLLLANIWVLFYSIMSVFSPSYLWLLILRGLTGMGLAGCMSTTWILYSELTPTASRARAMIIISLFWSFGVVTTVLLAAITVPSIGWRFLVAFCSVPLIISLVLIYFFIIESPSYLIVRGQSHEAVALVNSIATFNKKPIFTGSIRSYQTTEYDRGNAIQMFNRKYLSTTVILFIVWFTHGFCYYGAILVTTTLPQKLREKCHFYSNLEEVDTSCCRQLTWSNYVAIIFSSLGEVLAYPICVFLSDCFGRRWSLRISLVFVSISILLLYICVPAIVTNVIIMAWSVFILTNMYTSVIYTTEVYPTVIRATSFGVCHGFARFGTMLTSFVAQIILPEFSIIGALLIYSGCSFIAALCCLLLPYETRNRRLKDRVDDVISPSASVVGYQTFKKSS